MKKRFCVVRVVKHWSRLLRDIENMTGHGPEQLALADPAQSRAGLDWMSSRGTCQPQPCCSSIW